MLLLVVSNVMAEFLFSFVSVGVVAFVVISFTTHLCWLVCLSLGD